MRAARLESVAAPKGLIGGPFGSSLVGRDYADEGIPVIRGTNLSCGRFISGDFAFVPVEKYQRDLTRNTAVPGDVIYTQRGTLGQVAIVPVEDHAAYVVSQSQMRLRVDPAIADPMYVYYASTSSGFLRQIQDRAISTGVPHINLGILADLTIPLPPLAEQRAIAMVLGALDDKIEVNRKLAATADDLSRWRFKAMQANPVSEPLPLSSTARFVNGRAFTKDASGTGRVVIRIAELNSGLSGSTVRNDIEVPDEHLARPGDLLFAWSGSLTLARWFRDEAIVNQHIFKVLPNDGYPLWLVNHLIRDKLTEYRAIAADKATTMGHIQRRHLDEPVLVPPVSAIRAENQTLDGLWRRALLAEIESESLAHLRDTLLPRLMSGELRVEAAREMTSA